jgi:hypothetical protein
VTGITESGWRVTRRFIDGRQRKTIRTPFDDGVSSLKVGEKTPPRDGAEKAVNLSIVRLLRQVTCKMNLSFSSFDALCSYRLTSGQSVIESERTPEAASASASVVFRTTVCTNYSMLWNVLCLTYSGILGGHNIDYSACESQNVHSRKRNVKNEPPNELENVFFSLMCIVC